MYPSLTFLGWFFSRGGWWWWWWQHREERASFPPGSLGPWVVGGGGVGRTARTVGLGPWVVFSVEVGGGGDSTARSERKPRSCLSAKGAGGRHGYPFLDNLVVRRTRFSSRNWVSTLEKISMCFAGQEYLDIYAWISMYAWRSLYGYLHMVIHVWVPLHGYPCTDI